MPDPSEPEKITVESAPPRRSCFRRLGAVAGIILSVLFLLNLSFGVVEIPDNLPFVGNLDEVVVTGFLLACFRYLGVDLLPFARGRDFSSRNR